MSKKVAKDRVEIKNAIEMNQEQIKGHLNELVRQSVEETLNVKGSPISRGSGRGSVLAL